MTDNLYGQFADGKNAADFTQDWDDPVFFDDFQLDEIPCDVLPPPFNEMAAALSEKLETPESATVMCLLSIMGTALQGKFVVQVDSDYREPLNLYLMVAMPPANRKSAILKYCLHPILKYEEDERKRLEPIIKRLRSIYCSEKRLIENERKNLTEQKAKEGKIQTIADKEASLVEPPALPKLFLTDATTESLSLALTEQKGKLSILSDEGGILDTCSGLYTGGQSNIDVLLKGWDGGSLCIKRKDREVYLNPIITIFMIVQPVIFENMSKNKNYIGKGFFERFLFCEPKSKIGYRTHNGKAVPEQIITNYETAVRQLLAIPVPPKPSVLKMSARARTLWHEFQTKLEPQLGKGGSLENFQGWGGKLCGQTVRIAGLLHLARYGKESAVINEDTFNDAIRISKALISHAGKVFDNFLLGTDSKIKEAQYVWNAVKQFNKYAVSHRDIVYALRHKMVSERIKELMNVLEERNLTSAPLKSPNGRSITYLVNPKAFEGKVHGK